MGSQQSSTKASILKFLVFMIFFLSVNIITIATGLFDDMRAALGGADFVVPFSIFMIMVIPGSVLVAFITEAIDKKF